MSTAEHCRAMAAEADRLASIVSYGRDKERLLNQAQCWRAKADALDAAPPPEAPENSRSGWMDWLRRRCA